MAAIFLQPDTSPAHTFRFDSTSLGSEAAASLRHTAHLTMDPFAAAPIATGGLFIHDPSLQWRCRCQPTHLRRSESYPSIAAA
jgi:hypothetical protein